MKLKISGNLTKHLLALAIVTITTSAVQAYDLKFGSNMPPLQVHGFASQGLLYSSENNYLGDSSEGSLNFTELGVNIAINPLPHTRIAVQGFAFSVGDLGKYEPFLDYASIEYTFNDYIGLRGGRVRKPGGIYNHIQDVDLARTWVLLPQGIYNAGWRDFSTSIDGGEVFGNISMGKAGGLSYEAYAGYSNIGKDGGVGRLLNQSLGGMLESIDPSLSTGIQLWWNTPLNGLRVGASFQYAFDFAYSFSVPSMFGPIPAKSHSEIPIQQYSIEYVWKSWTFQAEYYRLGIYGSEIVTPYGTTKVADMTQDAWYFGAAYRFNKWLELGGYYSESYANVDDRNGSLLKPHSDGYQKDATLTVRFDPTDWWIIKLEGHYIRGTQLLQDTQANPNPQGDGWWMLAVKTTISF